MMSAVTLRELGAILVAAAGFLAGQLAVLPYRRRVGELEAWRVLLHRLEPEVAWEGRGLPEAFRRAADGLSRGMVGTVEAFVAEARRTGESTGQLWMAAIDQAPWLAAEDRGPLRDLGPVLGRHSADEQARHLRATADRLTGNLEDARLRERQEGRMWGTLATLTGVALAVLLV